MAKNITSSHLNLQNSIFLFFILFINNCSNNISKRHRKYQIIINISVNKDFRTLKACFWSFSWCGIFSVNHVSVNHVFGSSTIFSKSKIEEQELLHSKLQHLCYKVKAISLIYSPTIRRVLSLNMVPPRNQNSLIPSITGSFLKIMKKCLPTR